MKRKREMTAALLIAGLLAAGPARAESAAWEESASGRELPVLDEAAELSDHLAYAALNSPELASAFARWQAALEKVPQVSALPDPRFTYSYLIREVETRVGPQRQKFGLTQTFPWFGKLDLSGDVAAAAAEVERQRYEGARRRLFREVTDAYAELYYLGRALEVTGENHELLARLEDVIRARYRTGGTPNSSLIRAQVERGKLEDRLFTLQDLRSPLSARLNALLGRPVDSEVALPGELPEESLPEPEDELLARINAVNPELIALDAEARRQAMAGDLARKQFWPDISIGVEYVQTGEARMPNVVDSGKDPFAAMLSINIPLWRGKYRAAEREASARERSVRHAGRDMELELSSRLKMAYYGYRDAERKIALYGGSLVPQGEQALAVTEEAFRAGNADFNSLIDAERVLLEFQLAHERAIADRAQRLAEIEMLAGSDTERKER